MVRSAGTRPRGEPNPADPAPRSRREGRARSRDRAATTYRAPVAASPADRPSRRTTWLVFAGLALAVFAFTGGWLYGDLTFDGPGVAVWTRIAVDHFRGDGYVPFWVPAMWAGTPGWAVASVVANLSISPFVELFGVDRGLQIATVLAQIVAAWGAYVLARSLWGAGPAPVLAGLFYALSPVLTSHAAIFGVEPSTMVLAATPWFVWSLRLALKRGGGRWIASTSLILAFAVLQQEEYAFGLALLGLAILGVELLEARRGSPPRTVSRVVLRALAVGALGFGLLAHWLLPFVALKNWFALNPAEELRHTLGPEGIGGLLGAAPESFLTRPSGFSGRIGFDIDLLGDGLFYLSAVLVALTFVTAFLLIRQVREGATLGAILLVSTFAVWTSTALTPFSRGNLADAGPLPSILIGILAGLLVGGLLQRFTQLGPWLVIAVSGALAIVVPYVAPFEVLHDHLPLFDAMRFPRLYPFASLGLALGGAYPIHVFTRWYANRSPATRRYNPIVPLAVTLVVLVAFLVDIWPTASFYRVEPRSTSTYSHVPPQLRAEKSHARAAASAYADSRISAALVDDGWETATGWPHPLAGKQIWRLTAGIWTAPPGFRNRALGLAGVSVLFLARPDLEFSAFVDRNPDALPLVRSYRDALVVEDEDLATDLAVDLAPRGITVLTGDRSTAAKVGPGVKVIGFIGGDPCDPEARDQRRDVAAAVARACSRHGWIDRIPAPSGVRLNRRVGALVTSPMAGLQGIDVALGAEPPVSGYIELTLRKFDAERGLIGPVVRTAPGTSKVDGSLGHFGFDPIPTSAGATYVYSVRCAECSKDERAVMFTHDAGDERGNLVVGDRVRENRVALYELDYGDAPSAPTSPTRVTYTRPGPGQWRVRTNGPDASMVVVSSAYFPGWSAKVDGRTANVVRADGAFVGVDVPPGRHVVSVSYHAPGVTNIGYAISLLALVVVLVLLLAPRALAAVTGRTGRGKVRRGGRRSPRALPSDSDSPGADPPAG